MIGALVIFSDLTARKETQRRMAQAERLATLGELMAGVAHEVRNPLTAIRGYVQILRQQTSDPIHQEYLSVVLKEIDSINKVIQQLLEFHVHATVNGNKSASMHWLKKLWYWYKPPAYKRGSTS